MAETWECSTHPDGVSTVCCGTFDKMELTAVIKAHPEYLGERHKGETTLPILVKLIDARKDLSVQVHPDDDYAKMKEHGQLGKTEMWYVLDAARDAKLIYGLRQDCTKKEMQKALAEGTVMKYLQKVPIHKSDVLKFLLEDNCSLVVRPSGTEPKLKIYISVSAENKEMAEEVEDEIAKTAEKWIC